MTNKEKLNEEYNSIVHEQIDNGDVAEDMYPIMSDLLGVAIDYVPAKVLKRIIARYKDE